MKKILAALDFSNASDVVLHSVSGLAKAFDAEVQLIHVVEPEPTYTAYGFTPDEFPAIHVFQAEARKRAEAKLNAAKASLAVDGVQANVYLAEGRPLQVLLDHALDIQADLVVLGAHGHGFVASLLLGSVAEGMVRKAAVPTLVVPAPALK